MTTKTIKIALGSVVAVQSDITPVGSEINVGDLADLFPHNFAGVEFFSDDQGTAAQATAGSVTISAKTAVNPQAYDEIKDGVIDATALRTVSFAGNITDLKAVASGVEGATHYRLNLYQNRD